ncbi:MAG TPA: L-threonylcarbamoyladenylate synthase [Marmoricola sp.]|nr:L-threonylcarbamoyladenylate synthase [Marmoricola sp.]
MSRRFDTTDPQDRERGIDLAVGALQRGDLVVLPTDTVYGLASDAFRADGVEAMRAARGSGRSPLPVMVASVATLDGIAQVPATARDLVEAFWPGALTLVCAAQPSLAWDLGDARGTVSVRMPLHPVALEVIARVGPTAVTSANRAGGQAPLDCHAARDELGDAVAIYLDAGSCEAGLASTVLDVTGDVPRVLREGAVPLELLREVAPDTLAPVTA